MGPSEVFVDSLALDTHRGFLEASLKTAKTSSTGRLIVVLTSALAMG